MFWSKSPSVFGLVSIRQATSSSAFSRRSSTSTPPSLVGRDLDDLVAGHRHGRRVGAVGGVRGQHLACAARRGRRGRRASSSRPASSPCEPAERLQRDVRQARRSRSARRCRLHISSSAPWARFGSCAGCRRACPGSAATRSLSPRVVLHRARAERVEAGVEVEVAARDAVVVADDLGLGDLGQPRRLGAQQARRDQLVERRLGDAGAAAGRPRGGPRPSARRW